jgi:hypothetical protein
MDRVIVIIQVVIIIQVGQIHKIIADGPISQLTTVADGVINKLTNKITNKYPLIVDGPTNKQPLMDQTICLMALPSFNSMAMMLLQCLFYLLKRM